MAQLTLYTNPMSRGRMARWMLEEVGQPYEAVILDFATTAKTPEYLALNPMGKVPTLTHGDTMITECGAIITWLAMQFPEAGLLPDDRGHFLRWMFFAAGPVEQAVSLRALGVEPPAERRAMLGHGDYDSVVGTLRGLVAQAPYLAGDRFTALDIYLGGQIIWGTRFGTLPADPAFLAYAERISDRPAAHRANEKDNATMPQEAG